MNPDPLSSYLYEETPEPNQSKLEETYNYIKSSLVTFGFPEIGNLFSPDLKEVKKTLDCFYSIIEQRQKDLQFRSSVQDKMQKIQSEKNMYYQKLELANEQKQSANSQIGKVENQLRKESEKWKKEKEKLTTERDEFRKDVQKLLGRESKLWHEIKKKDSIMSNLKEQLRKALGEKDMQSQNQIELTEVLHEEGPKLFGKTAEGEYTYLVARSYDENQNALLSENQELRSAFEILHRELEKILKERKAMLVGSKIDLEHLELIDIHSEIFQMPFDKISQDLINTLQENMRRFRILIQETSLTTE